MSASLNPTRSEVKWLANELAAVAGELQRIEEGLSRVQARREHLKSVQAALSGVAGLLTVPELPAVVPVVRVHRPWGGRGGLRGYFRATLKAAYPGVVDTRFLAEGAARHFGTCFDSEVERDRFRRVHVGSTLRKLVAIRRWPAELWRAPPRPPP